MRNCGKLYRCVIAWYCSTNRARNSRPFRWSPWDLWDRKIWIGFNAENKIFSSLYMPRITHMLFVNTNDYFSRCSVKGGRGKTQWERLQVLYLTRPTKKKKKNLPIVITETLHMPRLQMVIISFDAVILPLEKSPCLYQSGGTGDIYHSRWEQRRAVVNKAASHKTKHYPTSSQ